MTTEKLGTLSSSESERTPRVLTAQPITNTLDRYATVQDNTLTGELVDTDWDAPKNAWPNWIGSVAEAVSLIGADPADTTWSVFYSVLHLLANTRIRETLPTAILDDGAIGPTY